MPASSPELSSSSERSSEQPKVPKAKVRAATAEDFEAVYPLLQELNSTRFTREIWQRLFTNLWSQEDWCPGYVLDTGSGIVGFLGGLISHVEKGGETSRVCNLTAWIVKDEYRSNSIMLLMPFLRQKNTVLTSLTSSPEAYKVYKKLGFKDLDDACRILYPVPAWGSRYELLTDSSEVRESLTPWEQECFEHHKSLDVQQCLIRSGDRHCYLLITRRLGRGHIQEVGDVELFRESIGVMRGKLCKVLNVKSLQVDERFLAGKNIFLSRKKAFAQPKQFKGKVTAEDVTAAYSELAVLATP